MPPPVQAAARAGWALAGVGAARACSSRRRRWWPWLLLPAARRRVGRSGLTGDADAALAGFLAVGAHGRRRPGLRPALVAAVPAARLGVALVLLLAPDAYAAFGLLFLLLGTAGALTTATAAPRARLRLARSGTPR